MDNDDLIYLLEELKEIILHAINEEETSYLDEAVEIIENELNNTIEEL